MVNELSPKKTGFALGAFLGLWHFVWSLLIATGFAQGLLNFVLRLHSLNNPYQVTGFSAIKSVALIVVTSLVGFVFGFVFAKVWNAVHN